VLIGVTGSTSLLAKIIIPVLKLDANVTIMSLSRSHHELADIKIDWELGEKFDKNALRCDYILHFAYDRSCLGEDISTNPNIVGFRKIYEDLTDQNRVLLPASFSSDRLAKSIYGRVKYYQEEILTRNEDKLVRIGFVISDNEKTLDKKSLIYLYARLPIVFLPSNRIKKISILTADSVQKLLLSAIYPRVASIEPVVKEASFTDLLDAHYSRKRLVIQVPLPILTNSCLILRSFAPKRIKQLADSLLSLIPLEKNY